MKRMLFALTIAMVLVGLSLSAQAATQTTTMEVQAIVPAMVTVSANNLNFGDHPAGAPVKDVNTQILVTAQKGLLYKIAIDRGLHYNVPHKVRRCFHKASGT